MSETAQKSLIVLPSDKKAAEASERHKRARKIVDLIFSMEPGSARRWRAIWRLWLTVKPITHYQEHLVTLHENKRIRGSLLDPKFGRSQATLNKGRTASGKPVQDLRIIGNMPESLYYMLKRFDPYGLGLGDRAERKAVRRKLYTEFQEYKIAEKL